LICLASAAAAAAAAIVALKPPLPSGVNPDP
jgi:hypothetical protein